MPGIKDYISVKRDELRVHAQKRLILGNLKELYIAFKEKHPGHKIDFSKFADLRPKECILAGRNGTHSVCVCTIHQNFKLMIIGAYLTELTDDKTHLIYLRSYKTIISKIVCDSPTSACYFLKCQNCLGIEKIAEKLEKLFDKNCIEQIPYKSWTLTDRSLLETHVEATNFYRNL